MKQNRFLVCQSRSINTILGTKSNELEWSLNYLPPVQILNQRFIVNNHEYSGNCFKGESLIQDLNRCGVGGMPLAY